MDTWVRRLCALAALTGATWLVLMARGVQTEARTLLSSYYGDGIVTIAGLAAAVGIGLALAVVFSPVGKSHGPRDY
ncbi:MAG TPA: hypothetical protein VHW60_02670 [Caulobacteraceae bacterium]|jgi:hypothetical protein|nr:hypothetical protein [Caulobacteraceae bacterium]